MYIGESENFAFFLPDNLVLMIQYICHLCAQSDVSHTQYMLLTHADNLLCLQLHTVGSPYTVHAADTC